MPELPPLDTPVPAADPVSVPWKSAVAAGKAKGARSVPGARLPRQVRKQALTQRKLDDLARQRLVTPIDCSDSTVTGLVARVRPSGTVSYFFRWRGGGTINRIKLKASTLDEARKQALAARSGRAIGRDPRAMPAAHSQATSLTVADAVPLYLKSLERKGRSPAYLANVRSMFANHVLPDIGRKRLIDLIRTDVTDLYEAIGKKKSNKTRTAERTVTTLPNRVHVQIVALLNWAARKGHLPDGTMLMLERPIGVEPSQRRERDGTKIVLRLEHLAQIWLAVAEERLHVRHLVRLLLLLPSRRQEITALSWPEVIDLADEKPVVSLDRTTFDGPRLDLPPARMKGR